MIAYHITPTRNLKSILKYGLKPKKGYRSKQIKEPFEAIYFFPKLEDVHNALDNWFADQFSENTYLCLLQVDVEEYEINTEWEIISYHPIIPEKIKIIKQRI